LLWITPAPRLYNLIEIEPALCRAKVHTRGRARRGGVFSGHAIWPGGERNTFRAWYEVDLGDHGWSSSRASGHVLAPGSAGAKREEGGDDRRRERAVQVEAAVAGLLLRRPKVAAALARKLKITAAEDTLARAVAKALVHERPAREVALAANHVDAELARTGADRADRAAIRDLLFQILPLVADWRVLVDQWLCGAAREGAIELPLASATIAEIVVAGIDERICKFAECNGREMPVGAAAIRAPAAARAPLFDVDGAILVEAVVKHVAEATRIEQLSSYDKTKGEVEGHLRYHAAEAPDEDRLPYYLLFEEDALGQGEAAQSRWVLARSRIPAELPSLRLVRLEGGAPAEERILAEHIRAILNTWGIPRLCRGTPRV
jgi:hypothetical protein